MKIKKLKEYGYEKFINRFEHTPKPIPQPKPSNKQRFEFVKKGKKLDKFV